MENELNKPKTFDLNLFIGQSYLNNDGAQFYLIFKPILETIKIYAFPASKDKVSEWISKGVSNKRFAPIYTENKIFSPEVIFFILQKMW